ncbi:hypothetical protein GOP47_0018354, partial [Adiantum capillus-veneris]
GGEGEAKEGSEGNKDRREAEDEQEEVLANDTVVDSTDRGVDSTTTDAVSKRRGDSPDSVTLQELFCLQRKKRNRARDQLSRACKLLPVRICCIPHYVLFSD